MLKRALAAILTASMLLSFTACAGNSGEFEVYEGRILGVEAPAGSSSLYIKLKPGWTVYTVDGTLCFNASDMKYTLPLWNDLKPGDRVRVWADKDTERGQSAVYCILRNLDGENDGGFYRVAGVEENGERLTFTDADGTARVTVDRENVHERPELLCAGATCFVWYSSVKKGDPDEIEARSVSVVTSPEEPVSADSDLRDSILDSLDYSAPEPTELQTGPEPTPEPPEPTTTPGQAPALRGNSTGNIVNDGEAAFDGESLIVFQTLSARFANLYKGHVYYVNMNAGGKIYRQPLTGEQAECICDATDVAYLNVTDDLIFYRSTDDGYSVHRMELDGSGDVRLSAMRASRLAAVDGYLYYANWDEGSEGLWRMDYNGEGQTLLYGDDVPLFINVYNDRVYWISNENDKCLASTDPDTGKTVMAPDITNASSLNAYDFMLYFYMENETGSGIYAVNLAMTQLYKIYEAKGLYNINIANDTIYFRTSDDILYCCGMDGSGVRQAQ